MSGEAVEVKACPWCEMPVEIREVFNYHISKGFTTGCDTDGCRGEIETGPVYPSKKAAIEANDRRAPTDLALLETAIGERDEAEDAVSQIYFEITGISPEWSNLFGYEQAIEEIKDKVNALKAAYRSSTPTPGGMTGGWTKENGVELEAAWRMMEKKGPHYDTCSLQLSSDATKCDCGYVLIHKLVLSLPSPPTPEA